MSREIWQNLEAAARHAEGLRMALDYGNFEQADRCFTQTISMLGDDEIIEQGHVHRDWARVHAGLGRTAERNNSIGAAVELHEDAFRQSAGVDDARTPATALAASLHVDARICLAKSFETGTQEIRTKNRRSMATSWEKSINLFERYGDVPDFFEQMVTHGTLGMSAYGEEQDQKLTERIADAAWAELPGLSTKRKIAVYAGHAALADPLRRFVRPLAYHWVAKPYMTRRRAPGS